MQIKTAARTGIAQVITADGYVLSGLTERRAPNGRRTGVVEAVYVYAGSSRVGVFNGDLEVAPHP